MNRLKTRLYFFSFCLRSDLIGAIGMASNVGQGSGSALVLIILSIRHRHLPVPLLIRGETSYLQPPCKYSHEHLHSLFYAVVNPFINFNK